MTSPALCALMAQRDFIQGEASRCAQSRNLDDQIRGLALARHAERLSSQIRNELRKRAQ